MPTHFAVKCLDCGSIQVYNPKNPLCGNCGSEWSEAIYDYAHIAKELRTRLASRPFTIWRYAELLPVTKPNPELSLGEGGTPLIHAVNLGIMLGNQNIYIKDERQGPTSSFKDRQAAITVASLKEFGVSELVCASTGNVAIAYSAYAARAGIKLWAFLTSLVPETKMREVALYGTQVVKITGSYDQAKHIAETFAKQRKVSLDLGSRGITCIEGMKTIAYEIAEQFSALSDTGINSEEKWNVPDWYLQPVSGGLGPLGVLKGFTELSEMNLINKFPKFGIIQVEGCAPMVHAWHQDRDTAIPTQAPHTLITTLSTGDPGRAYTELHNRIKRLTSGAFESVTDDEAFRAMHLLAKLEGISVEPAAAVVLAGLIKLIRAGIIKPGESVVMNCTGHTTPIESHILGENWGHEINADTGLISENQEEGLLAALNNISLDKFPRIVIVDDEPQVRLLVRRILQSQGNFTLFEASDGRAAIDLILKEKPNLVVLDLMMPEIDGFSVMETMHSLKETRDIPIIVMTAKELTFAEKERLKGHIKTLMQKGNFMSDDFLDEVNSITK
jgi:threonine synthase